MDSALILIQCHDQVELMVAVYYEPKGGSGFSPGIPGGTFSTPGGIVHTPSTPGYFTSGGFGYWSYKKSTYFKGLFQAGSYEHVSDSDETKGTAELIEDELDDDNKSVISFFDKNNFLYLGYYEKKNEAYIIQKMGKLVEN